MNELIGRHLSWAVSLLYILYFAYIAARVLRDFGEMLVTFAYQDTPLLIVNAMLMIAAIFAVRKGIEVIARAGELLFGIMYFLTAVGLILIISSGTINLRFLQPVLAEGAGTVIYSVFKQTMFIPFGELIVFVMIFPYLKDRKKVKKTGFLAIIISGLFWQCQWRLIFVCWTST